MAELQLAHTSALDAATLAAARALLDQVFGKYLTDHDWDHSLGGMHALIWDDGELVAHGAVVQRQLLHRGRALRTGYVEGVAVRRERQGQGYGAEVMNPLEEVVRRAYELGALGSTERGMGFYAARGWQLWHGPTSVLTPTGIEPTAEDSVFVLPVSTQVDPSGELTCDWREGDVW